MLKLYDFELSGNCYKVRLLLSMLGVAYEKEPISFYPAAQHKSDAFLEINPLGQLPVIDDNGYVLRDAQAILSYLARRYDASQQWLPVADAALLGEVLQWMAFADGITATASAARLHDMLFYPLDVEAARAGAHRLYRILDEHLWFREAQGGQWLCSAAHPTVADIACFPYVVMSEDGGIPLLNYPAIRRWTDRVKRIPGFVVMSGVFPTSPAAPASLAA
jgi:glutathione S-transferase